MAAVAAVAAARDSSSQKAAARDYSSQKDALFYLHFPKCGDSFSHSMQLRPSLRRGKGAARLGHRPLDGDEVDFVAAMFREPRQRWLSSFHYLRSATGCCGVDWGWPSSAVERAAKAAVRVRAPLDALGTLGVGCMTRMILGDGCMSDRALGAADVAEAVARVEKFAFVGVLEEWALSVCLFNFRMTGARVVTDFQLDNTKRRGRARPRVGRDPDGSRVREDATWLGAEAYSDPLDGPVYAAARARFDRDAAAANVSAETCADANYTKFCAFPHDAGCAARLSRGGEVLWTSPRVRGWQASEVKQLSDGTRPPKVDRRGDVEFLRVESRGWYAPVYGSAGVVTYRPAPG